MKLQLRQNGNTIEAVNAEGQVVDTLALPERSTDGPQAALDPATLMLIINFVLQLLQKFGVIPALPAS